MHASCQMSALLPSEISAAYENSSSLGSVWDADMKNNDVVYQVQNLGVFNAHVQDVFEDSPCILSSPSIGDARLEDLDAWNNLRIPEVWKFWSLVFFIIIFPQITIKWLRPLWWPGMAHELFSREEPVQRRIHWIDRRFNKYSSNFNCNNIKQQQLQLQQHQTTIATSIHHMGWNPLSPRAQPMKLHGSGLSKLAKIYKGARQPFVCWWKFLLPSCNF